MDSTTKVSKSVARKLSHYLNKERVESEYDPSGKGLHTTHPLMANYELAYLVTTDDNNMKSLQTEKDESLESQMLVLPCLVPSAQCKSHVRKSDAKRVTNAARQVISSLPVKEIDLIQRYRPACRAADTLEMGKVSQMSRSVHAMLNTKEAVDFAVKHDKKTQRLRAKSAHQLRRPSNSSADGVQSHHSSKDQHRADSAGKSARKKKLRQKYTELPCGPGNSSHIATWLSEQREKDKKAVKKKEKQKKRAEKEAEIEKERRDKEEITTAMKSLQNDNATSNDKDEKKNEDHTEQSGENTNDRKGRNKNRKHKCKDKKRLKEKVEEDLSSCSSKTNVEIDQLDNDKHPEEKSSLEIKNKRKEEESRPTADKVDTKHGNDKCDFYEESTDTKDETLHEPITATVHKGEPIREDLINDHSYNKSQGEDKQIPEKNDDEKEEKIVTQSAAPTKASEETVIINKDSDKDENGSKDTDNTDRQKTRSGSQTSVRTVEYVRTESVVSLPRS